MARKIRVDLEVKDRGSKDVKKFSKTSTAALKKVERQSKKTTSSMKSGWKSVGRVLTGAAILGTLTKLVTLSNKQAKAEAQLKSALKSTAGAAELSFKQMKDYAISLQDVTLYGDEAIITTEAMLATFKEIKGDVFKDALVAILDLSQAMGQDLKSSAVQLGKALNDPIVGLTALQRVGITFTEQQKKTIKTLAETGRVAEAQRLILAELRSEFGGSARAAAAAQGGGFKQFLNILGDIAEVAGESLAVALDDIGIKFKAYYKSNKELVDLKVRGWMDKVTKGLLLMKEPLKFIVEHFDTFLIVVGGLMALSFGKWILGIGKAVATATIAVASFIASWLFVGSTVYTTIIAGTGKLIAQIRRLGLVITSVVAGPFIDWLYRLSPALTRVAWTVTGVLATAFLVLGAAMAGIGIGTLLNKLDIVKKAAVTFFGFMEKLFFTFKWIAQDTWLSIQIAFLEAIDIIKSSWIGMMNYLISKTPDFIKRRFDLKPLTDATKSNIEGMKQQVKSLADDYVKELGRIDKQVKDTIDELIPPGKVKVLTFKIEVPPVPKPGEKPGKKPDGKKPAFDPLGTDEEVEGTAQRMQKHFDWLMKQETPLEKALKEGLPQANLTRWEKIKSVLRDIKTQFLETTDMIFSGEWGELFSNWGNSLREAFGEENWKQIGDSITSNFTNSMTEALTVTGDFKEAFGNMATAVGQDILRIVMRLMFLRSIEAAFGGTSIGAMFGFKDGGVTPKIPGAADGAVLKGPKSGYPVMMHGNETIMETVRGPGGSLGVKAFGGGGGGNTISISVPVTVQGGRMDEKEAYALGETVGKIVDNKIRYAMRDEKRVGGINRQRSF